MDNVQSFTPNHKFSKENINGVQTNVVTTNKGGRADIGSDDAIMDILNEESRKRRSSLQASDTGELFLRAGNGHKGVYLRQIANAFKEGITVEEFQRRKTRVGHIFGLNFLEDGTEDCRPEMLFTSDRPCYFAYNRKFDIIPGPNARYVALTIYQGGKEFVEYLDYNSELIKALATPHRFCFLNNGFRVQVGIGTKKNRPLVYLSVIAAAYKYGMLDVENLEASILAAKKKLRDDGEAIGDKRMTVDHFNSDSHNHCGYNISIVPHHDNVSKKARAGAFGGPYSLYGVVTDDNRYLACFCVPSISGDMTPRPMFLEFDTIEDFNDWLRHFFGKGGLFHHTAINHLSEDGDLIEAIPTPKQVNPDVKPLPRDFAKDCQQRDVILDMYSKFPELFHKWTKHDVTLGEMLAALSAIAVSDDPAEPVGGFVVRRIPD